METEIRKEISETGWQGKISLAPFIFCPYVKKNKFIIFIFLFVILINKFNQCS